MSTKTERRRGRVVLLRTDEGRYEWWPALQCVDFLLKGQRTVMQSWNLDGRTGVDRAAAIAKVQRIERLRRQHEA